MSKQPVDRKDESLSATIVFALVLLSGLVAYHVYDRPWLALSGFVIFATGTFLVPVLAAIRASAAAVLISYFVLEVSKYVPILGQWPLDFFLVFFAAFLLIKRIFKTDFSTRWDLRFSRKEWFSVVIILVPTIGCLVWYYVRYPEIVSRFPLPKMSWWTAPIFVALAAAINGLREELLYRYFLQRIFTRSLAAPVAVLLQAVAFGFLHFQNGFPQGWVGVVLTSIFGLALGVQYYLFNSITLVWLTHSLADAIMFSIIIIFRR